MIAPEVVRWPPDQRLAQLAEAQPIGWWKDHAGNVANACCRTGEPGCELGWALFRLHSREMKRRGS